MASNGNNDKGNAGEVISITVTGMDGVVKAVKPEVIAPFVREFLWSSALATEGEVKKLTPVNTGLARASWVSSVEESASIPIAGHVQSQLQYIRPLEFGSAAHFAPIGPLQTWAHLHGLPPAAAWAIRASIARRGTKAVHMGRDGLQNAFPTITTFLHVMVGKIAAAIKEASK